MFFNSFKYLIGLIPDPTLVVNIFILSLYICFILESKKNYYILQKYIINSISNINTYFLHYFNLIVFYIIPKINR